MKIECTRGIETPIILLSKYQTICKRNKITTTLTYRPVGPKELALIEQSGWTKFHMTS